MSEIYVPDTAALVPLTSEIVSAYVANNQVAESSLPGLIAAVHEMLKGVVGGAPAASDEPVVKKATPNQIKESISADALISFINGKPYQTLKRHLAKNGFDPHSYRVLYWLPADYPMTAFGYSARRSELAKSLGLVQLGHTDPPQPPEEKSAVPVEGRPVRFTQGNSTGGGVVRMGSGDRKPPGN